ncbi:hypothetical protein HUJ04_011299 [Dendroctonus ponderosae]|nr:hypothetical protein HUJ04_011299 [Dendroctonus ponderosae]
MTQSSSAGVSITGSKSNMAPRKNFSPEEMAHALQQIASGMSVAVVARQTRIPRTTLFDKSSEKHPKICKMGSTSLTNEEETLLVQWIILLQQRHFPITKTMLLDSVERIITGKKQETAFKSNRPGDKWFNKLFLRRHPEISPRVAQNLTPARENVSERQLRNWFSEVKEYLISKGLFEITN